MKVKVIKRFHDMKEKKIQEKGEILEVDETRMNWLVSQGMVEELREVKEEPAAQQEETKEPKEKKNTAKVQKGAES